MSNWIYIIIRIRYINSQIIIMPNYSITSRGYYVLKGGLKIKSGHYLTVFPDTSAVGYYSSAATSLNILTCLINDSDGDHLPIQDTS